MLKNYRWTHLIPASLPIIHPIIFFQSIDKTNHLYPDEREQMLKTCFRYWAAIGEPIWPMVTSQPDNSFPVVKLSQFSSFPESIYYAVVEGMIRYFFPP